MLVERLGRRALWLTSFGGMLAVNVPFGACSAYVHLKISYCFINAELICVPVLGYTLSAAI